MVLWGNVKAEGTMPMQNKEKRMSHGMSVQLRSSRGFQSRLICEPQTTVIIDKRKTTRPMLNPEAEFFLAISTISYLCAATTSHPGKNRFDYLVETQTFRVLGVSSFGRFPGSVIFHLLVWRLGTATRARKSQLCFAPDQI